MSEPDQAGHFEEARRWITVADHDLHSIELCLNSKNPETGSAAFFCQQAAEKMLKALLVASGIEFPKTHDLDKLYALASPAWPALAEHMQACRGLTPWNAEFRYPSSGEAETFPEVREITEVQRQLVAFRTALGTLFSAWS